MNTSSGQIVNRGQPPATRKASTPAVLPNQIPVETSELIHRFHIHLDQLKTFNLLWIYYLTRSVHCTKNMWNIAQVLQILLLDLLAT